LNFNYKKIRNINQIVWPPLIKSKGNVLFNGQLESWYLQKSLSVKGLKISYSHISDDGLVRKGNICVVTTTILVELSK
jgi:hypothetical protein